MPKYRKKPVVIEARVCDPSVDYDEACDALKWAGGYAVSEEYMSRTPDVTRPVIGVIPTLEGDHLVTEGDMIIQGVRGEFYSCKPDIFAETYEEVEDASGN